MVYQAIIFFGSALAVVLATHSLLYFSIIKFFGVYSVRARLALLVATVLLGVSFIATSALVRFYENVLTKSLYFASGVWLGLFVNLLLACVVLWLLRFIFINNRILSVVLFAFAFAYSAYGVYNAFHPQIKNIDVTIKNLPSEWQGKKIVQLSDLHIGAIYGRRFLGGVVEQVNSVNPDLVAITGDLIDGMDGIEPIPGLLNQIKSKNGVYFVTGNHETYFGLDKTFAVLAQTNANVLDNKTVNIGGLQIVGVSYPANRDFDGRQDIKKAILSQKGFVPGEPTVLLYHAPTNIQGAKNAGVNLQLSGHTHYGQIFPFMFITKLIYGDYDYGLRAEGDYNIYTTNGVGTWGPPMRTFNTPEIVVITLR